MQDLWMWENLTTPKIIACIPHSKVHFGWSASEIKSSSMIKMAAGGNTGAWRAPVPNAEGGAFRRGTTTKLKSHSIFKFLFIQNRELRALTGALWPRMKAASLKAGMESNSTPNAATKVRSSVQVRWAFANVTCSAFLTTSDTKALKASRSSSPEGRCLKSMMDIIWLSPTTGAARAPDRYAEGGREPLTAFDGAFAGLFSCSLGEIEGLALALGAACNALSSASNRRAPNAKPARLPSRANCHALATARPASAKASSKLVNMNAKSVGVSTPWTAHQVSTFSASAAAIAKDSSWDMAILAQTEPGTDSPKKFKIHGVYHSASDLEPKLQNILACVHVENNCTSPNLPNLESDITFRPKYYVNTQRMPNHIRIDGSGPT